VKGDGSVWVDKKGVTLETLVAEIDAQRANRSLVVKGDKTAKYGQVREVIDLIHEKIPGTDTMLLATEKLKVEGEK
jgi:biopolymer transport protein ExbD